MNIEQNLQILFQWNLTAVLEKLRDPYSPVQWIVSFYLYCFFGWIFESTYVSLKCRKPVNRGFMRGPLLSLYGSGAVMMLFVSIPLKDNPVLVYFAGCVAATLLEYVTGVAMEALFKVRYWDYSSQPLNFQGHICLTSSIAWGFLTLFLVYVIHEPVQRIVLGLNSTVATVAAFCITIAAASDFSASFRAAMDLRDVLVRMEKIKEEMERLQKRLDVVIAVVDDDVNHLKRNIEKKMKEAEPRMEYYKERIGAGIERIRIPLGELRELEKRDELGRESLAQFRQELEEMGDKLTMIRLGSKNVSQRMLSSIRKLLEANPTAVSMSHQNAMEELQRRIREYREEQKKKKQEGKSKKRGKQTRENSEAKEK